MVPTILFYFFVYRHHYIGIATLEKPVYELDETPHVTKGPVVNKDNARQKEPRTPIRITPVNKNPTPQ